MKHINNLSKQLPAQASLIESAQKISVTESFFASLSVVAEGITAILGLRDVFGGGEAE